MKELNKNELLEITGGGSWSGAFFNSVSRAIDTVVNVGRSFGSAIRRITNGTLCPL